MNDGLPDHKLTLGDEASTVSLVRSCGSLMRALLRFHSRSIRPNAGAPLS